jgi:DNA polymerase-3 subunit gamma/tau
MADPHDKSEDGNYVVVARRYRPRGFDELVGQEHVCRALVNAIQTNRVGHAYLFREEVNSLKWQLTELSG